MNENINKTKEYIEKVKEYIEYGLEYKEYLDLSNSFDEIVNLIKKQQAEIEKQSKIINLMAEQLTTDIHSKEWVMNYFERKIEEE